MRDVFVVEDETLIRMMVTEMVEELGHRVIAQAGTIREAEPLARDARFDLGPHVRQRKGLRSAYAPTGRITTRGNRHPNQLAREGMKHPIRNTLGAIGDVRFPQRTELRRGPWPKSPVGFGGFSYARLTKNERQLC